MLSSLLLAASLCAPGPLPSSYDLSADKWRLYVNTTLHACFDYLGPLVAATPAAASDFATIGASLCQNPEGKEINCAILIEPAFLEWAPTAQHIAVIIAHEAEHIASHERDDLPGKTREQEEYTADLFASLSLPQGACLLVDIYEWHIARTPDIMRNDLPVRVETLKPLCAVQKIVR